MLDAKVAQLLNEQVNKEFYSAYLYLDFSIYYEEEGLDGFANWYKIQAQEERDHAMLMVQYLQNNGGKVTLEAIAKPDRELTSRLRVLELGLEHERYVTGLIHTLYEAAYSAKDFRTMQFLDWFVKEQGEEEKNAEDLIKKMKLYGEDAKGETGKNIMNPQTIVYLGENSTMQMDTIQIRGIDSTLRDTQFYCEAGSEVVVTERLLTHGAQTAESDMTIQLNGEGAKGRVISRSVAQDTSRQVFHPVMVGNSQCFGHVQCDSIIMGQAHIESIPAITANCPDAQLIHEAAIGKIAGDQLLKLETLGLSPEEAEETILKGFLA